MEEKYQTVKILKTTIVELKKVLESRNISIRSDAEAVNVAINHFILNYQVNNDNTQDENKGE